MTLSTGCVPIVLLPGLDGTGDLFERFVAAVPRGFDPTVIRYSSDRPEGYEDLIAAIEPQLPDRPFVVVGESFSGPLALEVARRSSHAAGVGLVSSFVLCPRPLIARLIPWSAVFRGPASLSVISYLLTAGDLALAREVRQAISKVTVLVLVKRVRSVLSVDAREALAACTCPVLCLRAAGDRVVPSRELDRVVEVKPSIRHETLKGPHLLLQAAPDAAWTAISGFVAEELPGLVQ